MRILEIAPPYKALSTDSYGGIERVVLSRSKALSKLGHEVTILGPVTGSLPGLKVLPFKAIGSYGPTNSTTALHWIATSKSVAYMKPYVLSLRGIDRDYDVVLNDALRYEPWTGLVFLTAVNQDHAVHILHANFVLEGRLRRLLDCHYSRFQFGILSTGQLLLARSLGYKCSYTPNGIEAPARSDVVQNPAPYLISMGRIDEFKAPHLAIEIADRLQMPLKIVGPIRSPTYYHQEIEPRLSPRIQVLGEVPRYELVENLRKATALVFTSQFEDAQPAVLQEALSYGVPILGFTSSRAGGFQDIVIDHQNGIRISNLDDLADGFKELVRLDRLDISEQTALKWSWDAVVTQHFQPLLGRLQSQGRQ
jgi:glycosyltransferase involved in cell wall biosynthesis